MADMTMLSDALTTYIHDHTTPEHEIFERLRAETYAKLSEPQMQVGRVEGRFLELMVKVTGAKRVLEIGTFSGYSSMAMAAGLPEGGKLITCDVDPAATKIARRFWDESPWGSKIELRLGDAKQTLSELAAANERFDLVFIDADKSGYVRYFELALEMLPIGGVILADNTLWSGRVIDPQSDSDRAIVRFNEHVKNEPRVEQVLLSVRDGIMFCRKRA
ncbi:Caffeoyl-CoA O-methyltransferase [Enhygromyxa salina]|uniref:Caffeoyl-CoA O-methyltransferase n=1 Tax=Enhygromyxa salina TaxID=215803 RepID=A0A0C2D948_9BACT|nr:class I SAM-dependent methyltransferase [Enhygromyxa salina]KIG19591.1 Caffeoyl-CoA O-methyltransferase [Enhygromyxa salina]